MKILAKLEKSLGYWFLIIISIVFFFLRFPSLFEPNWYGDEGIYQVLGLAINHGRFLYRDIFDNKPPFLYLLYSFVSSDQFMIRLISLLFGLFSVYAFYYLAKKLFSKQKVIFVSTGLFAILFGLPLIEGNIANAENFMLLPNIIAGFLVLKAVEQEKDHIKYKLLFSSGFILGLSFLFKIVAVFDFAAFFAFVFFANYSKNLLDILNWKVLKKEIQNLLPLIFGFIIPILGVTFFFVINNSFSYFLKAVLFNNIGYVEYGNKLIIPQGLLILKLILLLAFCLFVFYKRKSFGIPFVFVSLWFAFSLFDAYFSQRPYTHYVLMFLPSFCLMIGLFMINKNFSKTAGVLTIASFIAVLIGFGFYLKTAFYYQNFISYIFKQKSVYQYQRFFDSNTPNDYLIASFINLYAKKDDNIFIWGNNAQVYKLTNKLPPGKYAVSYHITSYKDGYENTNNALKLEKPKFIVIMPNVSFYPFDLSNYYQRININGINIYERIY